MAICSFLGHSEVYDADIVHRLQAAVDKVVAENDSVDFWLPYGGSFYSYCLLTALKAKSQTTKEVHICLFVNNIQYDNIKRQGSGSIPACMFDKIYIHDNDDSKKSEIRGVDKMLFRMTLKKATHIICYLYRNLYSTDIGIFNLKKCKPDIEIITVATGETEQAIIEYTEQLPDRERFALQKWNDNFTLIEIGKALGFGGERARQLLTYGSKTIRKKLRANFGSTLDPQRITCGVFSLGKETYDTLMYFHRIISYLISEYDINSIYIDGTYAHSPVMVTLKGWQRSICKLHVTAVISEDESSQDLDNSNLHGKFCPPCDAVMNVSLMHIDNEMRDLSSVAAIIEQSDFCVFDFSTMPYVDKLKQNYIHSGRTVLLDIGKADFIKME